MPWLIIILGYFLGSIPTAYIVGHILKGVDNHANRTIIKSPDAK